MIRVEIRSGRDYLDVVVDISIILKKNTTNHLTKPVSKHQFQTCLCVWGSNTNSRPKIPSSPSLFFFYYYSEIKIEMQPMSVKSKWPRVVLSEREPCPSNHRDTFFSVSRLRLRGKWRVCCLTSFQAPVHFFFLYLSFFPCGFIRRRSSWLPQSHFLLILFFLPFANT